MSYAGPDAAGARERSGHGAALRCGESAAPTVGLTWRRVSPFFCASDPAAMLIHIHDTTKVDDLCAHYRRSGFRAASLGGGVVEIFGAAARSRDHERQAVLMHLRVWQLVNPDVAVRPLDEPT